MEKEKLEGLLIDFIDGKLNDADRSLVEKELAQSEEAYRTYEQLRVVMNAMDHSGKLEPRSTLKDSFEKALREEIRASEPKPAGRQAFFKPSMLRAAAGLVIALGLVAIGYLINENKNREDRIAAIQKEMEATKQIMLLMMGNPQSASQRMQGVNVALGIERADDEVVNALAKTMNEDPNTNVRLAAVEALSKFHEEPYVRKLLIGALANQKDPVVQIALIQLMVRMKEKSVIKDLEKIVDDANSMKAVKDEAYSGLLKLS